ncbi:MAG: transketolase [Planctomycetaceae bacterium]|nr:transketolase [Planctomycetaceae bacterium]
MRNAFAKQLTALGEQDERIVLLSGDIGNRMFDDFKQRCPGRFFNCGIAEGNMMSMAAGLAMSGMRPVVYTITPFVTTRCLEQIRVDVCYHRVPVVIMGVGGGLAYASLGATHHSCEDIGFLRLLPNMAVVCPGDAVETRAALKAAIACEHGVYVRLGKKGEPEVHSGDIDFELGKAIVLAKGKQVTLVSTGNMLPVAVEAADLLQADGIEAGVASMHTVKPLDTGFLNQAFASCEVVVTVEEHSAIGGLGGAVAEWLSEQEVAGAKLLRIGTADHFLHEAGNQQHARECYQIDAASIVERILSLESRL